MNSVDLKAIGSRISDRRKRARITQEQLAEKMGVSVQMVSNLERGNKAIRIDNLVRLCEILEVSTDYILTGTHFQTNTQSAYEKLARLSAVDFQMIELMIDYCLKK